VYGDAIAFVDMRLYLERGSLLYGVPIRNAAGVYTAPTRISVETNIYNPLSRRLYLQIWDDEASLANTKPFIAWGLSNGGSALLSTTPFLDLPLQQRTTMSARLGLPIDEEPLKFPTRVPKLNCDDDSHYFIPDSCGLLNLNFLCLRGCGFFRRLLGFCDGLVAVPNCPYS
jgi:hypothetical protein